MTFKEKRFCSEYLLCNGNGSEAARKAGYSEATAGEIACENLKKPHIQEEIKRLEDLRAVDVQQEFRDLAPKAKQVLDEMLIDPETPATVRAKVAQTLLDYGGFKPEEKIKGSLSFYEEIAKIKKAQKAGDGD